MIKIFPTKLVVLPDEGVRFQRNISLSGGSTVFIARPEGIEPFKLERINAVLPGIKNTDTLPAGFLYPSINISSQSGFVYTREAIPMRDMISPMASQQWRGGVRINGHTYSREGLRIEISNYNLAVTPIIKLLFIGRRRLQHSGYTYGVK